MATQFIDNNKDFESLNNWNGFDGIVESDAFSCLHLSQTNANYTNYIELQENTTYTLWCEIKTTYTQYTYSNRGLLFDSYVVDSNGNEIDESGIDSWKIVSNSTLDANEWRVIELRINTIEFEEDSDYSSIMLRPKFVFTNDETNGIDIYIKNVSLEDSDRRYFGENLLEDTVTLNNGMFNVGTLENTGYRYYGGYIYQTTTSLTDGIFCKLDDLLAKKILRYGDLLKFSIYVKSTLEETIETSFTISPFSLYEETLLNNLWQRIEIEFTWSSAYENLVSNGIALYLRSTVDLENTDTIYYALPMLEILGDNADKTDEQWIPNSNDEIYNDYMKALIMSYGRGTKGLSVYLYKDGETTYTDLTEKITSYKEDDSSSSTDSFTLGSIGSKNISMTVINYDDNGDELLPRDLTNYYIDIHKSFENIYDDSGNIYVDEEQFRIYENPESFSKSMSLEFQDRMAELSTSYDSKLYYPDITEDEETTDEDTESEETEKTDINNLFSQLNYLSKAQGGATIINNSNGSFTISGSGTLTENYSNIYEYNGDTASEMITEGTLILSVESVTTPYLKVSIYGVNTVYPEETEDEEVEEDEDTEYDDTEEDDTEYEDIEEDTTGDDTEEEIVYETVTTLLAEMTTKESNEVQLVIDETYNDNESFIIEVGFYGENGDTIIEGTIAPKLYYYVEETTDEDAESEETTQEIIETTLPTGETGTWEVVLKYSDGTIISSTLMQSPTIKEQLEEIASSSNMEIDYSDIDESILNEYISFYDSTYSKRQYLGWIAEKSSCNVFVRGNTIIFEKININDLKEQYIDYFSTDMYVGDTFLIGRVCYDNGLEYYNKSIDLLNNDSGTYQLTASEDLSTLSLSLDTGHVVTLTSGNKYTFEFESNQSIGYTDGTVGAILYSSDDTQYNINVWASPTVFTCNHSGDYTLMFVFIASEIDSYATFSNFYLTEGEYSYTQLLGDTTYNTYYVDTTNMYITSQTDIDNIYEDLYKMEITGITGAKAVIGNANVRSTDLLKLRFIDELTNKDEKKVPLITYIAKHELTYNAEYSSSFECPIKSSNSENAESTTEESGTNTRIRKLSVSIDKTNLEMTVLAQQQTDLETKQSQFKLSLDQIAMSVSSLSDYTQDSYSSLSELTSQVASAFEGIDLINKEITNFVTTTEMESAISASADKIELYVSENYTSSVTLSETVTEITSTISDTKSELESSISNTQSTLEESISTVQSTLEGTISNVQSDLEDTIASTKTTLEGEISNSASDVLSTVESTYVKTTTLSNYATTLDVSSQITVAKNSILGTVSSTYETIANVSTLQEEVTSISDDVGNISESVTEIQSSLSTYVTQTTFESAFEVTETSLLGKVISNYYTKEQITTDYYTKSDIENGYYDKEYIDDASYTSEQEVKEIVESYIEISDGKISLIVSGEKYSTYTASSTDTLLDSFATSETMKSSIIQTVSEIEISASQISLEGYTTINGNFSIDEEGNVSVNGNITATSGTIGGFTINETNLTGTVNIGDRGETILGEVGIVLLDPENSKITITDSYTTDESDTILDATTLDSGGLTVTWSKNGSTNYYSGNYTYITLNNTGLLVKTGIGAEIELTNIDNNANLILGTEYAYGSLGTLSADSSSICLYSQGDLYLQSKTTIYLKANFVISDCSIIVTTSSTTSPTDGYQGTYIQNGGIELSHSNPYIDFHHNKSTSSYTSRIITRSSTVLGVTSHIATGSKISSSDGTTGLLLTSTGNIHLTSASIPYIYFYYANATSAGANLRFDGTYIISSTKFNSKGSLYVGQLENGTDGINGAILGTNGYLQLVGPSSTAPFIRFFYGLSITYTGQVDCHSEYMQMRRFTHTDGSYTTSNYIRLYDSYTVIAGIYSNTTTSSANVYVDSSHRLYRYSSSSYRYKNTINYFTNKKYASDEGLSKSESTIDYEEFRENMRSVLKLPIVEFHYNNGYITGEPDYDYLKYEVGFIAEDVYKNVPDATQFNEDGTIEMWNVNKIVPRMLFVLQEHEVDLSNYDERLMNLEDENLELRERILVLEETIEKLNAS